MLTWLTENLATIIICVLLFGALAAAVASIVRNKKKGKSTCGCGCSGCAMSGMCRGDRE